MEKKKILSGALMFLLLLLLLLGSGVAYAELTPPLPGAPSYDIGVEEAHEMLEENPEPIILLDVRTEREYRTEYIPGAINIPLSDLESRIGELDEYNKSKTIIVYCKSGVRSRTASATLVQHGFIVYNVEGGINAWKKEKFATSTATPTPMPTQTPVATLSPTVTPSPTPAASPSPITSPITTPGVPGFEVTFAIAAISMIAWCMLRKSRKA